MGALVQRLRRIGSERGQSYGAHATIPPDTAIRSTNWLANKGGRPLRSRSRTSSPSPTRPSRINSTALQRAMSDFLASKHRSWDAHRRSPASYLNTRARAFPMRRLSGRRSPSSRPHVRRRVTGGRRYRSGPVNQIGLRRGVSPARRLGAVSCNTFSVRRRNAGTAPDGTSWWDEVSMRVDRTDGLLPPPGARGLRRWTKAPGPIGSSRPRSAMHSVRSRVERTLAGR